MTTNKPFILTLDGPSGCGKSAVTQILANTLKWHALDSGAIYRFFAWYKLSNPDDSTQTCMCQINFNDLEFQQAGVGQVSQVFFKNQDISKIIRTNEVAKAASLISAKPEVRDYLFNFQRSFAKPPGLIAEGRDMGTVIFPEANLKVFMTAAAEIRAERRMKQLNMHYNSVTFTQLVDEIEARDKRDAERAFSPMRPAEDAALLDTSEMSIQQTVQWILDQIHPPNL